MENLLILFWDLEMKLNGVVKNAEKLNMNKNVLEAALKEISIKTKEIEAIVKGGRNG